MRLIDAEGEQIGVVTVPEALSQAEAAGLDLVEVSPQADPPVAKIVDWGKYQYEQTKQAQKAKRKQKTHEMKQMRFGLKIGQHDRDVKLGKVRGFLEKGHKVKLTVRFKGREMAHQELGFELLDSIVEQLGDIATVDQRPQMAGRQINMVVRKK